MKLHYFFMKDPRNKARHIWVAGYGGKSAVRAAILKEDERYKNATYQGTAPLQDGIPRVYYDLDGRPHRWEYNFDPKEYHLRPRQGQFMAWVD